MRSMHGFDCVQVNFMYISRTTWPTSLYVCNLIDIQYIRTYVHMYVVVYYMHYMCMYVCIHVLRTVLVFTPKTVLGCWAILGC